MTKQSAKNAIILINGYTVQTVATAYSVTVGVDRVDVTGYTEPTNYVPGLHKAEMTLDFLWDSDTGMTHDALGSLPATGQVTLIPEGYSLGTTSLSMPYTQDNYSPNGEPAGALKAGSIKFSAYTANARIYQGVALQHGTITNTLTGTGVLDPTNAAQTAACGGVLHIWDATATDTYVIKIQHSPDNSNWAGLVTFVADGTSLTAERQDIASGTVNKYRRVIATRTGSAGDTLGFTVTFFVK